MWATVGRAGGAECGCRAQGITQTSGVLEYRFVCRKTGSPAKQSGRGGQPRVNVRGVQLHARARRDLRGGGKGGWRGFPKKPFGGSLTEPATVPEIFRLLLENRAFDLQLARKMLVRGDSPNAHDDDGFGAPSLA